VTIDFLDRYLNGDTAAGSRMWSDGDVAGRSNLTTRG
jgi:hypothetical protein